MSIVRITESILGDIADAIREKKNTSDTFTPTEMADEISSIETGVSPITVNITQSEHQTIRVQCNTSFGSKTSSGTYSVPSGLSLSATVTPASGYIAGTLNQSSVTANWGDTVSFSATEATLIPVIPVMLGITFTGDTTSLPSSLTITIYESGNSSNTINVTFTATDNWIQTVDLKAGTRYSCNFAPTPLMYLTNSSFTTPSVANSSPITLSMYCIPQPDAPDIPTPA